MKINEVELSSNLSFNMTRDELIQGEHILDESEMFENDEDGGTHYRDSVQSLFDQNYDYFYNEIIKCKID